MPPKKDEQPLVWVAAPPGNEAPYLRCRMLSDGGDGSRTCVVQPVGGGPELTLPTSDVMPCNPAGHRPDNTQLLYLNEPCVLANIVARYDEQQIYTWTSRILIAVNPYEEVNVYTEKHALSLPSLAPRELPPHAFSIAELAYRGLLHRRESQAVVVSGESGSGACALGATAAPLRTPPPPRLTYRCPTRPALRRCDPFDSARTAPRLAVAARDAHPSPLAACLPLGPPLQARR